MREKEIGNNGIAFLMLIMGVIVGFALYGIYQAFGGHS